MRTQERLQFPHPQISYINNITDTNPLFGAPPPPQAGGQEVVQAFLGLSLLCEAPLILAH